MNRPNILYIHSHDTGRYIQPYGHAVATPRLQQLAEDGVLFRQNFCVGPTCSPSRAALLTGCYPHENGMTGLAHRGWALINYRQHMAHALRTVGYRSALAGVQHIATDTSDKKAWQTIGYDEYLDGDACEQAELFLDKSPPRPFFLSVGFEQTHRPFPSADPQDDPRYCLPPAPLPDTPETRSDMARYKSSVRELDRKIGRVLSALDRNGMTAHTLVVATTDHGIPFPRMKCTLHDSGIGTLLILREPGLVDGGRIVDAMTSHLDLFPTLCERLDIAPPPWLRGASLLPLIRNETDTLHDALFFEVNFHAAYEPMRAVRTKRWKYIRRYGDRLSRPVPSNTDDGESKSLWAKHGWLDRSLPEEALFDLMLDPNEADNRVNDSACLTVLKDMRERLSQWMKNTNDPLLAGPIRPPDGAMVNNPNALSPREETEPAD